MDGIIVHEAKVFNPYSVFEAGLLSAALSNVARFPRETFRQLVVEEAKKLPAEAKKIVFPAAIDYLAVLELSDIRNLRDLRTGRVYATYPDLDALRAEMAELAFLQEDGLPVWPEFDATINHPLEFGARNIGVSIGLGGLLGFEKSRAIHISAPFDGSSSACRLKKP